MESINGSFSAVPFSITMNSGSKPKQAITEFLDLLESQF
jgi:hypothetical protein